MNFYLDYGLVAYSTV